MLWTLLDSPFVQNALLASVLLSIGSGIIGSLIVANKSVFLAGGVAHSAFGGVGIALFLGYNALFGAIMAALVISGIMVYASLAHKGRLDIFISIYPYLPSIHRQENSAETHKMQNSTCKICIKGV